MKAWTAAALLLGAAPLSVAAFSLQVLTDLGTPYSRISAAHSGLYVGFFTQDAQCEARGRYWASFYLTDEKELFLLTPPFIQQQVFTDRSGFGQGHIGYITGNGTFPERFETKGWELDEGGNLGFKGIGLTACQPSIRTSWSLWLDDGSGHGGSEKCVAIRTRRLTQEEDGLHPVPCVYTS